MIFSAYIIYRKENLNKNLGIDEKFKFFCIAYLLFIEKVYNKHMNRCSYVV